VFGTSDKVPKGVTLDGVAISREREGSTTNADTESVVLVSFDPASDTSVAAADYGSAFGTTSFSADYPIADITVGVYHTMEMNATGLAQAQTDHDTDGVIRMGTIFVGDQDDSAPSGENYYYNKQAADASGKPYLEIAYTHPALTTTHNRKCKLTIQSSKVDAGLIDFPVYLNEDTLPSEMFDADGSNPAQDGGGDIRFTTDTDGLIPIPCEIVDFSTDNDPANGTAEIHVRVPVISADTDTDIYVWYNTDDTLSQPPETAEFGAQAVWEGNYIGVWHNSEDPSGSAPQMQDSTMNENDGTTAGSMTSGDLVDFAPGKGLEFDGSNDYVKTGITVLNSPFTFDFIVDCVDATSQTSPFGSFNSGAQDVFIAIGSVSRRVTYDIDQAFGVATGSIAISDATPYYIGFKCDAGDAYGRVNGAQDMTHATGFAGSHTSGTELSYGDRKAATSNPHDGKVSEFRYQETMRTDEWMDATYETLLNPTTFVVEGTPELANPDPQTVNVPVGDLSFTGYAPTVSISDNQSVEVPTGDISFTGYAPTVSTTKHQSVAVPVGDLSFTGYAPSVIVGINVAVPTGDLSFTGLVFCCRYCRCIACK
jgi:hypothetical protein